MCQACYFSQTTSLETIITVQLYDDEYRKLSIIYHPKLNNKYYLYVIPSLPQALKS